MKRKRGPSWQRYVLQQTIRASRRSEQNSMHCHNTGKFEHELKISEHSSKPAYGERGKVYHFQGACDECGATYWQHGSYAHPDNWTLLPVTCKCGEA
jgi:hypothetical protein